MDKLTAIINDHPLFHKTETETDKRITEEESSLSARTIREMNKRSLTSYGLEKEVLLFIAENIHKESKTLETGAGSSTLIFALKDTDHTAVTPSSSEIDLIKKYASEHGISTSKIKFTAIASEIYLPGNKENDFDFILIDGKHAFPWPILDWFFTADKLKVNGLMMIDDIQLRSVSMLVDFMNADISWKKIAILNNKTIVFKKLKESVHDVAWHMQPYLNSNDSVLSRIRKIVVK